MNRKLTKVGNHLLRHGAVHCSSRMPGVEKVCCAPVVVERRAGKREDVPEIEAHHVDVHCHAGHTEL